MPKPKTPLRKAAPAKPKPTAAKSPRPKPTPLAAAPAGDVAAALRGILLRDMVQVAARAPAALSDDTTGTSASAKARRPFEDEAQAYARAVAGFGLGLKRLTGPDTEAALAAPISYDLKDEVADLLTEAGNGHRRRIGVPDAETSDFSERATFEKRLFPHEPEKWSNLVREMEGLPPISALDHCLRERQELIEHLACADACIALIGAGEEIDLKAFQTAWFYNDRREELQALADAPVNRLSSEEASTPAGESEAPEQKSAKIEVQFAARKRRRGAPPGNSNRLIHGYWSQAARQHRADPPLACPANQAPALHRASAFPHRCDQQIGRLYAVGCCVAFQ